MLTATCFLESEASHGSPGETYLGDSRIWGLRSFIHGVPLAFVSPRLGFGGGFVYCVCHLFQHSSYYVAVYIVTAT